MATPRIRKLTKKGFAAIYKKYMVKDFPRAELKPLDRILDGMDKDLYECLAYYDEIDHKILAYAVMLKTGKHILLDYYAVIKENRGNGIGSVFLRDIAGKYQNAASFIGEVEDPDLETDPDEKRIKQRRLDFYLKNGFIETGVRTWLFGVDFILIESGLCDAHTESEIEEIYLNHYKSILPKWMYRKNVKVKHPVMNGADFLVNGKSMIDPVKRKRNRNYKEKEI